MATTALQVASRVTLIWWIVEWFGEPRWETAYVSMLGAWSLTEVVRYGYFVCALLGDVPGVLVWLRYVILHVMDSRWMLTGGRYNLFFILYPVGISSEAWLVYSSIPEARKQNPYLAYALYAILGIYVPGKTGSRWLHKRVYTNSRNCRSICFVLAHDGSASTCTEGQAESAKLKAIWHAWLLLEATATAQCTETFFGMECRYKLLSLAVDIAERRPKLEEVLLSRTRQQQQHSTALCFSCIIMCCR